MSALPGSEEITRDPAFRELKVHVVTLTGLSYFASREVDLASRLRRRMAATGARDCAMYLALARDPQSGEQDALIHELTIGETHFFRFSEQFEQLQKVVIPELIRKNRERRQLRIWSAGCSIGPEVYTLALLLEREFGKELPDWSVSILGTDIDAEFLERARAGVYAEWALRGLPAVLQKECFTKTSEGWRIDSRYQRWVSFAQHNLAQDSLPAPGLGLSDLDLILCRNVMIYFDEPTINRVVAGLQRSLAAEGWLLVGHAEGNLDVFRSFRAHQSGGTVLFQNAPDRSGVLTARPARYHWSEMPGPVSDPVRTGSSLVSELQNWRPYSLDEPRTAKPPQMEAPAVDEAGDAIKQIRVLVDRGDWAAASEQVAQLLKSQPLNALAHFYEGVVLSHTAKPEQAENSFRRALFLEPDLPLAYYQLGLLLAGRGARTDAQRAFRNTIRTLQNLAADTPLAGSELTVARLREAALLQLQGVDV